MGGLHKAGFRILAGVDNWKPALKTFKLNHPDSIAMESDLTKLRPQELKDILNLPKGNLDCLIGGPPCQGFSKNVPAAYRFLEDQRNQLFRNFFKFVEEFLPKTVVMENVAELYNAYSGSIRGEIIEGLIRLGYEIEVAVIFAADYGVPQRRRRCFFFASNTGKKPSFPLPSFGPIEIIGLFGKIEKYRSAWSAISDLPTLKDGDGYEPMPYNKEPQNAYQSDMRNGTLNKTFDRNNLQPYPSPRQI